MLMRHREVPAQHDTAMRWQTEEIEQGGDGLGVALEADTRRMIGRNTKHCGHHI